MRVQLIAKLLMDYAGGAVLLLMLAPFLIVIALLIKLDSPGPILFRQERIGKLGKPFQTFKFRSMVQGAEHKGLGYTVASDDERITKLGNVLRKWGIDEFPQLLNVLRGEMSLVGPRPTLSYQVEKYTEQQRKRLQVKPGLVGLALVKGRNQLSWQQRMEYDVWYIEHWSLWLCLCQKRDCMVKKE
jgi:undecaprenyl phosphate N,N'-diacetylbacillosamine 1-phosphate transferase